MTWHPKSSCKITVSLHKFPGHPVHHPEGAAGQQNCFVFNLTWITFSHFKKSFSSGTYSKFVKHNVIYTSISLHVNYIWTKQSALQLESRQNLMFQIRLAKELQVWTRPQDLHWHCRALCSRPPASSSPSHDVSGISHQVRVSTREQESENMSERELSYDC